DEAHLTPEDVPELRQLVHGRAAENPPDPCDARVPLGGLQGSEPRAGIRHHGPEVPAPEMLPAVSDALLTVEPRPPILDLDGQCDDGPERRRAEQPEARQRHVERALE